MPVVNTESNRRFNLSLPCFGLIDTHTAAKILNMIDFAWSIVGFLSMLMYGTYWYDFEPPCEDHSNLHHNQHFPYHKSIEHVEIEITSHARIPVFWVMILVLGFGGTSVLCYLLFRRLYMSNCAPFKTWMFIYVCSIALRPFAFLLYCSVDATSHTLWVYVIIAIVASSIYTFYGIWIIYLCKTKALPVRPLIVYQQPVDNV